MLKVLERFRGDEDGAVTVDWVVLTAAIVTLGILAVLTIQDGSQSLTTETTQYLNNQDLSGITNLQQVYGGGGTTTGG